MNMSVLVVDDSDIIRRMIIKTLRLAELPISTVHEAGNGREALDVMAESPVDVVLADINMPVMDGLEMIATMRGSETLSDVPVVVVSTEGAESRVRELERLGIAAYLRKPFTPEQIRDVLGRLPSLPSDGKVARIVDAVTLDVLEQFALVFAAPLSGGSGPATGECLLGRTGLRGAVTGIVSIAAPLELCREMACNILGADVSGDDAVLRATDTLGEVANMVAGHLATEIDPREHTSLSPPIVTRCSAEDWRTLDGALGTVRFDVEGWPLLASFSARGRG